MRERRRATPIMPTFTVKTSIYTNSDEPEIVSSFTSEISAPTVREAVRVRAARDEAMYGSNFTVVVQHVPGGVVSKESNQ